MKRKIAIRFTNSIAVIAGLLFAVAGLCSAADSPKPKLDSCLTITEIKSSSEEDLESEAAGGSMSLYEAEKNTYGVALSDGIKCKYGLGGPNRSRVIYKFLGACDLELSAGFECSFRSDASDPLIFVLQKGEGLIYKSGKGKVILKNGKTVFLPCDSPKGDNIRLSKDEPGAISRARVRPVDLHFLTENAAKPGIIKTSDGLQYKVLKKGSGEIPKHMDSVRVHYRGTLVDGTEFDSSIKRSEPSVFPLEGVIRGWSEALQRMPVGSKWQLFIPPHLGFGEKGAGEKVPPNAVLIFEVELLGIAKTP